VESRGFEWLEADDAEHSVLAFMRLGRHEGERIIVVCNFTPVPRHGYRVGVPGAGVWRELLNSDATEYGGSGLGNLGRVQALSAPAHGQPYAIDLTLPPLSILFLKREG
jgi:1,4-alpha-glucan branching enzyme